MTRPSSYEVGALLRDHQLWRKLLPTTGPYGPKLSNDPPSRILADGTKVPTPPYWWCKTCGVEFPADDERSWDIQQTEHQAEVVLSWLSGRS